jgi:CheY-like chemotaxis protein
MARVLIVDDEEMERVFERTILEKAGHDLRFASDGEAALKICRTDDVEVIVTDLAMPGFNGLRFIKELREDGLMMPVIAVSGWAADQLDLALEYGADLSLQKPIEGPTLLEAVETVMKIAQAPDRKDPWLNLFK